jgi:hypothetical protein
MSLAVRFLAFACLLVFAMGASAKDVYILVVGEGTAANCNEYAFGPRPGVAQIGKDGIIKSAQDPFEWSDCSGGSSWVLLGDKLIASGIASRVVFMPIAVARAKARDWLPGGAAFGKLTSALDVAKRNKVTFDYALWQQGYSDVGLSSNEYYYSIRDALAYISVRVKIGKWIIARGTGCPGVAAKEIVHGQLMIAGRPLYSRFVGPDATRLLPSDGWEECGLNRAGQGKMASLWFDSMRAAAEADMKYQKESLLYYFR